ncbi:MAG: hypothetical protein U0Z17_11665 [Bacteroidales bacterium]
MKKDNLEQFVKDHARDFDTLEVPRMAWDDIEKHLPEGRKPVLKRQWPYNGPAHGKPLPPSSFLPHRGC